MRTWWRQTLESLRDYIEVYGWADPTHTLAPDWVDRDQDRSPDPVDEGHEDLRRRASGPVRGGRRDLGYPDGCENDRSPAA